MRKQETMRASSRYTYQVKSVVYGKTNFSRTHGSSGTVEMLPVNSSLYSHKRVGADERKLTEVFEICDEDKKGYLSREDLKVAVVMLFGYKPSKMEVDSMTLAQLKDSPGVLLEQFIKLMSAKFAAQQTYDEIRQIFMAFDIQCRGFLTVDDFRRAFKHVAPHLSEQTILEAFREVDQDSDGHVSYKDFESAISYGLGEE